MNPLRTMPRRRLLGVCAAVVALGAGGVAVAQSRGGGSTPPPAALPDAIHSALVAQHPTALSARIRFTNHLIDSSAVPGASALLTGATGRLWIAGDGRARLELQSDAGDVQVGIDGNAVTVYDASSNTVYKATLPAGHDSGTDAKPDHAPPTVAQIQKALGKVAADLSLSGANPTDVAGQPAYQVRITPSHDAGLLAAAEVAWDAVRGVPLRVAIYASGSSQPVLALEATDISYGPVSSSDLTVATPAGAQVVDVALPGAAGHDGHAALPDVHGAAAVGAKLSFPLRAPDTLVGLPQKDVTLVDTGDGPSALVTYGKGLGGIAVLESPAKSGGQGAGGMLAALPKVSIDGATGSELPTALGTVIRVQRDGVQYVLAGSFPPAAAEAAARELLR
jgi:outer membrane lipoprotein-sorting protein